MSRRYCSECQEPHSNPDDGLCDYHLAVAQAEEVEKHHEKEAAWTDFVGLPPEEQARLIFEFMWSGERPDWWPEFKTP